MNDPGYRRAPRVPIWVRLLMCLVATAAAGVAGAVVAATWTGVMIGIGIALPFILLGALMPGVLAALLFVLQAFSCSW